MATSKTNWRKAFCIVDNTTGTKKKKKLSLLQETEKMIKYHKLRRE